MLGQSLLHELNEHIKTEEGEIKSLYRVEKLRTRCIFACARCALCDKNIFSTEMSN